MITSASRAPCWTAIAGDPETADLVLGALDPGVAATNCTCLLLGTDADEVTRYEPGLAAARVDVAPGASPDAPTGVLGPALTDRLGVDAHILFDSSQQSRDLAGWLTVSHGGRIVPSVVKATVSGDGIRVRRLVNAGTGLAHQQFARGSDRVVALTSTTTPLSATAPAGRPPVTILGLTAAPDHGIPRYEPESGELQVTGAPIVVAVGRGIGGPERLPLFRELARALGAALGATRVVVDRDWLPFAHQIGQTGAVVAPDLYLGFGVSGAAQHAAGMRDSGTVVAINTDADAPLAGLADVVVNADAAEVAIRVLRAIRAGADADV